MAAPFPGAAESDIPTLVIQAARSSENPRCSKLDQPILYRTASTVVKGLSKPILLGSELGTALFPAFSGIRPCTTVLTMMSN